MNYLTNWFYNINEEAIHKNKNNTKPCMLNQGKALHNKQYKTMSALKSNIQLMNAEKISPIEGFIGSNMTLAKNSSQWSETNKLSDELMNKGTRYETEQPIIIDNTRNFSKLNDRTKNIKDDKALYTNNDNILNEITYEKEGCYNSEGVSGLEYQSDLAEVSVQTCKMRASDLGYAGFAMRKNAAGQLGCYITKDVTSAKAGGIATKPVTSFTFKKSKDATVGALFANGQIGIYNSTVDNHRLMDLTAIEGCDLNGSLINDKTLVATYGKNCNK